MNRLVLLFGSLFSLLAFANASGAIGYSGAPGTGSCNDCHTGGGAPTLSITGPNDLPAGGTGMFTLTVSGGTRNGVNIAITNTLGALNPVSSNLGIAFRELYQVSPQTGGTYTFSLSAPPTSGPLTIYASANAVNGDGSTGGDRSANTTKVVNIMPGTGALPPTITMPAAPMMSPLRAKSTQVSIMAADDGPQGTLVYIWSATGPGPVTFSPNSSNAAATSTATFSRAGSYMITCTVRDSVNQTVTSSFALTVESNLTGLRMTPYAVRLARNATQAFTSVAVDQFDAPVTPQPTITYEVPAGGGVFGTNCINACTSNMFRAQAGAGGPFTVVSRSMGIATSSTVTVDMPLPTNMGDTTPPTVSIVEPEIGAMLMNGTVIEAVATDPGTSPSGMARVQFTIAEIEVPGLVATSPPWRVTFTPQAGIPGGRQALVAKAYDLAGNEGRSSAVTVELPAAPGGGSGTGGSSGTGGGSGTGGSGTGGGTVDPGGCACGSSDGSVIAGLLALMGWLIARRLARARR